MFTDEYCVCSMELELHCVIVQCQVKRPQAKAYFAQAITRMYSELSASDPTGAPQKLL